ALPISAELAELAGAVELLRDGDAERVAGDLGGGLGGLAGADRAGVLALPRVLHGGPVGELGGRVDLAHGVGAGLADAADLGVDVGGYEPVGGQIGRAHV